MYVKHILYALRYDIIYTYVDFSIYSPIQEAAGLHQTQAGDSDPASR